MKCVTVLYFRHLKIPELLISQANPMVFMANYIPKCMVIRRKLYPPRYSNPLFRPAKHPSQPGYPYRLQTRISSQINENSTKINKNHQTSTQINKNQEKINKKQQQSTQINTTSTQINKKQQKNNTNQQNT